MADWGGGEGVGADGAAGNEAERRGRGPDERDEAAGRESCELPVRAPVRCRLGPPGRAALA